jgi:hypothetical protein
MMDNNQKFTIGDDYYVQDVKVNYKPSAMYATLSIYSLDKLYEKKLLVMRKQSDPCVLMPMNNS